MCAGLKQKNLSVVSRYVRNKVPLAQLTPTRHYPPWWLRPRMADRCLVSLLRKFLMNPATAIVHTLLRTGTYIFFSNMMSSLTHSTKYLYSKYDTASEQRKIFYRTALDFTYFHVNWALEIKAPESTTKFPSPTKFRNLCLQKCKHNLQPGSILDNAEYKFTLKRM